MKKDGQYTFAEITGQTIAWAEALAAFQAAEKTIQRTWPQLDLSQVIFIGCGSTYYLSQTAAALFQGVTGVPARACPSSEILLFSEQVLSRPDQTLLVAISRSGTTTETLEAVNRFRQLGGRAVWGVCCYPESPLAQTCDLTLLAKGGQEQSTAQTRSFSSMLVLAQALAATIAGEDTSVLTTLPELGNHLLEQTAGLVETLGRRTDLTRFYFLGSGFQYGLANEVMLKMKEMSLSQSEAFHFLEFRHGPMSMVDEQTLMVGLLSDTARKHEQKVLAEMAELGASTLGVNALSTTDADHTIFLEQGLPAWVSPVLYLPSLQLLAYHRATSKGLDPDSPRNLSAVIFLEASAFASS